MNTIRGTSFLGRPGLAGGAAALLAIALAACGGDKVTGVTPIEVKTATLIVGVTGLPEGVGNLVQVTGPQGFSRAIGSTTTLEDVEAGVYIVAASDAVTALGTWRPAPATLQRTLLRNTRDSVGVHYAISTGSLTVTISGLPSEVAAAVVVTGPGDFSRSVSSTETIRGLVPGTYSVTAASVESEGSTYTAAPATGEVTVISSAVPSAVAEIAYTISTGSLSVTISGLPSGAPAAVVVTGPDGYSRSVTASATLGRLAPGVYTVTATSIESGGSTYTPAPATGEVTVSASTIPSAAAEIVYAISTGALSVDISGLPNGMAAAVVVTGPAGYSRNLVSPETFGGLTPGSYTVTAAEIVSGATTYTPAPATSVVAVVASVIPSAVAIVYSGRPSVVDDLSLEFAYVTQAVQRPAGDLSLVANRSALLRVFIINNRTNVLRPTVRARIYAGTTLLQTTTINAPELSVRTQTAEGTLSSTWNVVIPPENVRPNMRILVDVDPEQAIGETDESNNIWPRDGTPRTVSVVNAPPFNVRFVPVITGTSTGNVSVANTEEYLKSLRRMFPIGGVNAEVRLPFTSSKTQVTSTTADWGTVLSEVSALRSSDGAPSTMHYYGVVKVSYSSGIAGYGYVGGRSAIGWDHFPSGDPTAAHEWGHNFNRRHSPCGGVTDADPNYPYPDGSIGVFGWNFATGTLVQPTARDIMGYCSNQWVSDWTWSQVMSRRQSSGNVVSAATGSAAGSTFAKGDGLLVWGQVSNGQVTLEPAFRVDAAPTVPSASGSHRVQALDRRGQLIAELPIEAQVVDHAPEGSDIRQFAVVLPWSPRLEKSLATLRVVATGAPVGGAARTSAAAARVTADDITPELASPDDVVEPAGSNRVRVRWNASQFPMAMARDAATGQVIAFIRTPGAAFTAQNGRPIDLVYSDGVRSVVKRHQR